MSEAAPDHGVRFTLELARGAAEAQVHRYRGAARLANGEVALEVEVRVDGDEVAVTAAASSCEDAALGGRLARAVVPLVRTVTRSAAVRGQPLPRRIQRWREW